jgi:hypothetical protein
MRKTGIADSIKRLNVRPAPFEDDVPLPADRAALYPAFASEIERIESFLGRPLPAWHA